MLYSICQQIWQTQQWPQAWKRSVFIPIPKKGNARECSNYCKIAHITHASKIMLKILQVRLQQYVNWELPDIQAGFRKCRGTRDQIATSSGSLKKQESSRKTSISALLLMPKPLTVWITINCGKFWKRWVGAQHATGDQCRTNSRKSEETKPKQKHPFVDVTGDGSKDRCC